MALADRIAELMLQQGNVQANALNTVGAAQAQAAERIGQIQGQAQQRQGEIWGQTLQNLGQIPGQVFGQIQEQKKQQAELQTRALENQQRQLQIRQAQQLLAGQDAGRQLDAGLTKNPDGTLDLSNVPSNPLYAKMTPDQQKAYLDSKKDFNGIQQDVNQQRLIQIGRAADSVLKQVKASGQPLTMFGAGMAINAATPVFKLTPQEVDHLHTSLIQSGNPTQTFTDLRNQSPEFKPKPPDYGVIPKGSLGLFDKNAPTPTVVPIPGAPPEPMTAEEVKQAAADVTHPNHALALKIQSDDAAREALKAGNELEPVHTMEHGVAVTKYIPKSQAMGQTFISPPPASIQVMNAQQGAASNLPDWVYDASRGMGPDANVPDKGLGLTQNGLYQAALTHIQTGAFPPLGRGSAGQAQAQRTAIINKEGAIAADAGMSVPQLREAFKSNAASLTAMTKQQDAVQSFMEAADKNADLLKPLLDKLPDTGSPMFNQPLRSFETRVAGNPNMAPIAAYLKSAQNNYGRIISDPNLRSQMTDSSRAEATALLNPDATVTQLLGSLQALHAEGSNRLLSIGDQIKRITGRMAAPGSGTTVAPPTGRYNPTTGKVE
jgi:hypothetical protein